MTQSTTRRSSRATKAEHVGMAMYPATVSRTQRLTPHLVRVTLSGDELRGFRDDGPDQRFKLLLPLAGQDRPVIPDPASWYDSWLAMAPDVRPVLRTYTIRAARPERGEVDVDLVLHEPAGPASRWAAKATVGDQVALYGAWAEYEVSESVGRQLIVGDHTALPAIGAICERMPEDTGADVVIEVSGPADQLPIATPQGVSVRWLSSVEAGPGAALVDAVKSFPAGQEWGYAWVAADRDTVATVRRHLVKRRGLSPADIMFMGYWRTDGAIDD